MRVALAVLLAAVIAVAVPGPAGALGPFLKGLKIDYPIDWPRYSFWTHSEVRVCSNAVAYDIKPVDFGYEVFQANVGVPVSKVPARGVLIGWYEKGERGAPGTLGLTFLNPQGYRVDVLRIPVQSGPADRTCLGLAYDRGARTALVAWTSGDAIWLMAVRLGSVAYTVRTESGTVRMTMPIVEAGPILTRVDGGRFPGLAAYRDFRQVQVVRLGDNQFLVMFTGRNPSKPGEYGRDLLYLVATVDWSRRDINVKVGGQDLGFQSVVAYRVKLIRLNPRPNVIGLAFIGRWRQAEAGVWWVTLGFDGRGLRIIDYRRISDDEFYLPQTPYALLDFAVCDLGDRYVVLVVWNDSRIPHFAWLLERYLRYKYGKGVEVKLPQHDKLWTLYGQRVVLRRDGTVDEATLLRSEGGFPKNFEVGYLARAEVSKSEEGVTVSVDTAEIDSVTVLTCTINGKPYFVVHYAANLRWKDVAYWVDYAYLGWGFEKSAHGYDVFATPVPADPTVPPSVIPEMDECKTGRQETEAYVLYPVHVEGKAGVLVRSGGTVHIDASGLAMVAAPTGTYLHLHDVIPYVEVTSPEGWTLGRKGEKTRAVCMNQLSVRAVTLPDSPIAFEGYLEVEKESETGPKVSGPLYVRVFVPMVGPLKDLYRECYELGLLPGRIMYGLLTDDVAYQLQLKYGTYQGEFYGVVTLTDVLVCGTLEARPIVIEDHPSIVPTHLQYDLMAGEPPTGRLEVYYTTDFKDVLPPGSVFLVMLKQGQPVSADYFLLKGGEILSTEVSIPLAEALAKLMEAVKNGVLDTSRLPACAKRAIEVLERLPKTRIVEEAISLLKELLNAPPNLLPQTFRRVLGRLIELTQGQYVITAFFLPAVSDVEDLPLPARRDQRLSRAIHEIAYLGATSWVPLYMTCGSVTIRVSGGTVVVASGHRSTPTTGPGRPGQGVRPFQRISPVILPIAPPRARRRRS